MPSEEPFDCSSPLVTNVHTKLDELLMYESLQSQLFEIRVDEEFCEATKQHLFP